MNKKGAHSNKNVALSGDMVVGADPGSIPYKCKPASPRHAPAEGCGKVLTHAAPAPPAAIFRIFPILSCSPVKVVHQLEIVIKAVLLKFPRHWGVASLQPEEACVNTLVPQDMAQAVPVLGKTFDHNASDFWPGMRRGQAFLNRPGNHHGITPSLDRCRRPR